MNKPNGTYYTNNPQEQPENILLAITNWLQTRHNPVCGMVRTGCCRSSVGVDVALLRLVENHVRISPDCKATRFKPKANAVLCRFNPKLPMACMSAASQPAFTAAIMDLVSFLQHM